jgi:hypothetical protein
MNDLFETTIPERTLAKVKKLVENRNQISQALQSVNDSIGSFLLAVVDVAGGKSENLDDYIINLETGTIQAKGTVDVITPGDVEK